MRDAPHHTTGPTVTKNAADSRFGKGWTLSMQQWLPRSPDDLFPFFADAGNLERITPNHLGFHIITPQPIDMHVGKLIDYKLRIRGVPVRWTTEIVSWDPPQSFVDAQLKGPYRRWHHTHVFEAEQRDGIDGTLCHDTVDYHVPGGPLAPLVNRLLVQRDVESIFRYRAAVLAEVFA